MKEFIQIVVIILPNNTSWICKVISNHIIFYCKIAKLVCETKPLLQTSVDYKHLSYYSSILFTNGNCGCHWNGSTSTTGHVMNCTYLGWFNNTFTASISDNIKGKHKINQVKSVPFVILCHFIFTVWWHFKAHKQCK